MMNCFQDGDGDEGINKMSIVCHYNPIMDEFVTLTDENQDDLGGQEDEDIDLLFDLCKDDFPLSTKDQTVNVRTFLRDLEKTGLRKDDNRLQNLIKMLKEINDKDESDLSSIDNLNLNREDFKR